MNLTSLDQATKMKKSDFQKVSQVQGAPQYLEDIRANKAIQEDGAAKLTTMLREERQEDQEIFHIKIVRHHDLAKYNILCICFSSL